MTISRALKIGPPRGLMAIAAIMSAISCRSPDPELALPCATPESLAVSPLLYSDAIYGMKGTSGGTLIELSRQSAGWTASLEPVESDFEGEDDRWPEQAETLSVRWTDPARPRATLEFRQERADTSANRLSIGDSLVLVLDCQSALLENWDHRRDLDTVRLERRRNRGWPG